LFRENIAALAAHRSEELKLCREEQKLKKRKMLMEEVKFRIIDCQEYRRQVFIMDSETMEEEHPIQAMSPPWDIEGDGSLPSDDA
jgi:hypothetical protein